MAMKTNPTLLVLKEVIEKITADTLDDGGERPPTGFTDCIVIVYVLRAVNPFIVIGDVVDVPVIPPGDAVAI
jgi:hypothetical protein